MKSFTVILIVVMIAVAFGVVVSYKTHKNKEKGNDSVNNNVAMISFSYCISGMTRFVESYDVQRTKKGAKVTICHFDSDKEWHYTTDTTIFADLQAFIDKHKMYKYKRNYQPNFDILDGESWNFYVRYSDPQLSINSSGNNAYPKGGGAAFSEIKNYFKAKFEKDNETTNDNPSIYDGNI